MRFLALFLTAASAFAAIDGVVVNKTTGKPQPGANVTLLLLSAGMQPGGSAQTDAQGRFRFDQNLAGPALLQVHYQGVTYNQQVQPGSPVPELAVYETSNKPGAAKIAQHMLVLEPTDDQLQVSETFFFSNSGNTTFNDTESGTLKFFVPKGANPPTVLATGPNGMPLQRQPKTHEAGVYSVDFPVRPGETRFDVRYTMPFSAPDTFAGKNLYKGVATRFAVPSGVTLAGDGLTQIGQEPQSQALIYETAAADYKLSIEGTGALAAAAQQADEDAGPQIEQVLPRIYTRANWIVAAASIALMCGFVILYRKGAGSYKA